MESPATGTIPVATRTGIAVGMASPWTNTAAAAVPVIATISVPPICPGTMLGVGSGAGSAVCTRKTSRCARREMIAWASAEVHVTRAKKKQIGAKKPDSWQNSLGPPQKIAAQTRVERARI